MRELQYHTTDYIAIYPRFLYIKCSSFLTTCIAGQIETHAQYTHGLILYSWSLMCSLPPLVMLSCVMHSLEIIIILVVNMCVPFEYLLLLLLIKNFFFYAIDFLRMKTFDNSKAPCITFAVFMLVISWN